MDQPDAVKKKKKENSSNKSFCISKTFLSFQLFSFSRDNSCNIRIRKF